MAASTRKWRIATFGAMLALALTGVVHAQQGSQFFPETGQTVSGPFLQFWRTQGDPAPLLGTQVFGYPITTQALELNRDTGVEYQTQWFQRNRFELHTENRPPYDVLLGRLGDDQLLQLGIDWRLLPREVGPRPNCRWFAETNHNVCDQELGLGFRTYWETHGLRDPRLSPYNQSLQLFGLPLTEAQVETNAAGDTVLTQWFERARFEWHPNNPAQFRVLLGLLGTELRGIPAPPRTGNVVFAPPTPDGSGNFESTGEYVAEDRFTLTVTGRSPEAIIAYTNELRVITLTAELTNTNTVSPTIGQDISVADSVLQEHAKNLVIDIEFTPVVPSIGSRQSDDPTYVLNFELDPLIDRSVTHVYRQRCKSFASVRLQVSSGSVLGTLRRNGANAGEKPAGAPPLPSSATMNDGPRNPSSTYDLTVRGTGMQSSRYALRGTWDFSFTSRPPTPGTCQ